MFKIVIFCALVSVSLGFLEVDPVPNSLNLYNDSGLQKNVRIHEKVDEERSVGECTNLDPDNLLFNETLSIPARSRLSQSVQYTSNFASRGQEIIYCLKWTPSLDTAVTYSGGVGYTRVTFTLTAQSGKDARANYLVYGN